MAKSPINKEKEKNQCIICRANKDGLPVKTDTVITTVRWFAKNVFKVKNMHRLVVCKDCYLEYKKARKRYIKRRNTYIILGALFAATLIIASSKSATGILYAVGAGALVIIGLYALSLLSYVPGLEKGS